MARIEKGENLQKGAGGGGFGEADTSDDLSQMGNYEEAILNVKKQPNGMTIWEMLAELKVLDFKNATAQERKDYQYLTLDETDIRDLKAASFGAAGHGVNSEFAAIGIPFRAVPFASKEAKAVEKPYTVKAGADKVGKTHNVTETDSVKIYRTGEEFDPSLYAVKGGEEGTPYEMFGQRVSTKGKNKGQVLVYENFTIGQSLRADKWLETVGVKSVGKKTLKAVGIEVE